MLEFPELLAFLLFVTLFAVRFAGAQQAEPAAKVPVTTVVTVLGSNFTAPPALGKEDVIVHTGKQREDVTGWLAAEGENGSLDLAILIDDLDDQHRESVQWFALSCTTGQGHENRRLLRGQWHRAPGRKLHARSRCGRQVAAIAVGLRRLVREHLSIALGPDKEMAHDIFAPRSPRDRRRD